MTGLKITGIKDFNSNQGDSSCQPKMGLPIDHLNIWLVDDDPIIRFITVKVLSRCLKCTHHITEYKNGRLALDALLTPGTRMPDFILLDVNMPVLNGYEFLEAVREYGLEGRFLVAVTSSDEKFKNRDKTLALPSVLAFYKKPLNLLQASNIEDDIREARATMVKGVK